MGVNRLPEGPSDKEKWIAFLDYHSSHTGMFAEKEDRLSREIDELTSAVGKLSKEDIDKLIGSGAQYQLGEFNSVPAYALHTPMWPPTMMPAIGYKQMQKNQLFIKTNQLRKLVRNMIKGII